MSPSGLPSRSVQNGVNDGKCRPGFEASSTFGILPPGGLQSSRPGFPSLLFSREAPGGEGGKVSHVSNIRPERDRKESGSASAVMHFPLSTGGTFTPVCSVLPCVLAPGGHVLLGDGMSCLPGDWGWERKKET